MPVQCSAHIACGCRHTSTALAGERGRSQDSHAAQQQLLHFFDRDQSGTLDFNEFVLIVICLSVPEKDIEVVFDVMDLVRLVAVCLK